MVERSVLEDVDLDAREDPERGELFVERRDLVELLFEPLGSEPVGHPQRRRMVGHREVLPAHDPPVLPPVD
jgi:hypothetical protein